MIQLSTFCYPFSFKVLFNCVYCFHVISELSSLLGCHHLPFDAEMYIWRISLIAYLSPANYSTTIFSFINICKAVCFVTRIPYEAVMSSRIFKNFLFGFYCTFYQKNSVWTWQNTMNHNPLFSGLLGLNVHRKGFLCGEQKWNEQETQLKLNPKMFISFYFTTILS